MENHEERIERLSSEKHTCPYCGQELKLCNTPHFAMGDGLGWGDLFWLCLNDNCKLFVNSWETFARKYGKHSSCRYVKCPDEETGTPMLVCSIDAFKNSEVSLTEIQKKRSSTDYKKALALHKEIEERLEELEVINTSFKLGENATYLASEKRFMQKILSNFLIGMNKK